MRQRERWGGAEVLSARRGDTEQVLRVLFVDDDPDDLILLSALLDHDPRFVSDMVERVEDAVREVGSRRHDAYLVDLRLGGASGVDLIEQLAEQASGPMILLTGHGDDETDRRALASGAADFLSKEGLTAEALARSIRYSVETWKARREAEEGQARYRALFDSVPVGLCRLSSQGALLEVNRSLVDMLGFPDATAMLGTPISRLCADPGEASALLGLAARVAGEQHLEVRLRRADGSLLWAGGNLRPVRAPDGALSHVEVALLDVTRRALAEERVSLREAMLDQVGSAVIGTDPEGRIVYWNRGAEQMYGWTAEEALGREVTETTVPEGGRETAEAILLGLQRDGRWEGEFRVLRRDGSSFPAHVIDTLVRDEEGRLQGVVGVSTDITFLEQAQARLERRALQQKALADLSRVALEADDLGCLVETLGDAVNAVLGSDHVEVREDGGAASAGAEGPGGVATGPAARLAVAIGKGTPWGTLLVSRGDGVPFDREDGDFLAAVANLLAAVAERQEMEQARSRLAAILEATSDLVAAAGADGRLEYLNRAGREMVGLAEGASPDGVPMSALHPAWAARLLEGEALPAALEHGLWQGESALLTSEGAEVPVSQVVVAHRAPDGTLEYVSSIARDLSERLGVEESLRQSEAFLQEAFHGSPIPQGIVDLRDGRLVSVNQAMGDFLGCDPRELEGRSFPDVTHPDDLDADLELVARMVSGEIEGFSLEKRYLRADGAVVWGQLHASLVGDASGRPQYGLGQIVDITSRKQAETQIRFQASLLEQVGVGVVATDAERRVVSWNRAAEEITGWRREEVLGRPAADYLVPDDKRQLAATVRTRLSQAGEWEGTSELVRRDGGRVPIMATVEMLRGDRGEPSGVTLVITDISELEQARRELRFQATLLDQVNNGVLATDLDGRIIYWNRWAEELFGWTREEVLGRPALETLLSVPEPEAHVARVTERLVSDDRWEGEVTLRRKDGSTFPAWSSEALVRGENGEPVAVVGVKVDLSDLRRAEEEARRQGDLARSVLESLHFPVAVLARDGRILAVNRAWTSFSQSNGGDPSSCGEGADYLLACRGDGRTEALVEVETGLRAVLSGRSDRLVHDYDCHSPLEERWFRMEATPIPGMGAVVAHWDVTDERTARNALEELLRAKDEFIASVSHELRTPLTAVVGLSQELRDLDLDPGERAELEELVVDQAQEVAFLVEDLLVAARIDTDTIAMRSEVVRLREAVEGVVRPWGRERREPVRIEVPETLVATGDAARVRQILRNLVANAFRHGAPPVEISGSSADGLAVLRVSDGGRGLPSAAAERLFEPYARAPRREGLPASVGLGLYVSRRLARLMGGDLRYEPLHGRTSMVLALPGGSR